MGARISVRGVVLPFAALGAAVCALCSATPAMAAVAWSVRSIADPTHFSANDATECSNNGVCDKYQLVVRNVGDDTSNGPITVTDTLPLPPAGTAAAPGQAPVFAQFGAEGWKCTSEVVAGRPTVACTSEHEQQVAPEAYTPNEIEQATSFTIPVHAPSATTGTLRNEVTVMGGGATTAGATVEETASVSTTPPAFEVTDFGFEAIEVGGGTDTQAALHPYDVTASFDLADVLRPPEEAKPQYLHPVEPVEDARAAVVELPVGFIGDPQATPTCSEAELAAEPEGRACPPGSRVGVATLDVEGKLFLTGAGLGQSESAIYNLTPQTGYPAEFAFEIAEKMIPMYASVVHTGSGYRVRVATPGIPAAQGPVGASLTFFGNPAALNKNKTGGQPVAFFTNPANCSAGPLSARIEMDSWEDPGRWVSAESTTYPQIEDCDLLRFEPRLEMAPSPSSEGGTSQADEPSAYNVDLKVPQTSLFEEHATPELNDATVTLPEGVSVSPSAADGLAGCQGEGPEGINIGSGNLSPEGQDLNDPEATELGAGHAGGNGSPYDDGLYHTAPGHCPAASMIATAEVLTPLLASPLTGHVYLAQPKCGGSGQPACTEASATNGELYGIYLEVAGSGVIVKLKGKVEANPSTGRLTSTFSENPQLPFSELKLHFNGGPGGRAPLANPQSCGSFATTSVLTSWAGQEIAGTSPSFDVDWDGNGGACPSSMPFAPGFSAGTTGTQGGAFSPFLLSFSRNDREQDLSGLSVTLPPGLLGKIAGIPLCGEAQANAGTCGPESQLGTASVLAGPGPDPLYVSGGRVYLTTGYGGGPFGLSIVVPAVAGPFNLGNVVVRAAIHINPETSQVTVTTDPLPQSRDGVPFRLRTVYTEINRPSFMFNPTNCAEQQITGTIAGAQKASAGVSSPFAATGCASLSFQPDFSASTTGKTSKALGAALKVRITSAGIGQANIAKVDVEIPKALPTQLKTLNKACTEAQFNGNPAGCPPASDIAQVTVRTPLLNSPLTGPAYLVSHGGAAFPDVEMVLQGEGVELVVDGKTQIKQGITYSHFETVPDAPFTSFEFNSPQGSLALFTANGDLCDQKLVMPTTMTGQNGALLTQSTPVEVEGCSGALSIVSSKVKKRTLTLSVYAPGAGKVSASGKGVSRGSKTYSGREALTFTLKQKRVGKLKTKVKLTYTPSKGKKQTKTIKARFRR